MAFDFSREVEPFKNKVWLASPTMHGDELEYMKEAYDTNWMTTAGSNINALEEMIKEYTKSEQVVALSSGTSALHLAMKLAGIKGGDYVFCSDVTFSATANPITYEGGIPVFIDSEYETWNMDPEALEKAFEIYPDVKVVVLVHLYGVPARIDEIRAICDRHGALLIEDAAESLGATYKGQQTGTFGQHSIISFNGNKIITGSSGGALLTSDLQAANKVRKWSTQAREQATWYQHEEIGYNYRMSNVIAGVVRGQMPYLDEHIAQKKAIYERYQEGLKGLPIKMNPFDSTNSVPNYWLSCLTINPEAMAKQVRSDNDVLYTSEKGKTTPSEILDALNTINAEGRPIWKPMHSQPIFRMNPFITKNGNGRAQTNAYIVGNYSDVGTDLFERGLCLPSDNKMTVEEQNIIIETIRACFE
ncbi:aminotransferase class I/II-fold pyridoxal phosphate-dependent enzyme [Streptococcus suis]|nr:aminotransferase class I/II-fold pyridoxal phosphate-dependent enzyme [Streptococcus suis]NQI37959.1 aminotransferase class I/II-fold pyridoxal phosphate-dependent enzyme [Streptococcus suis]NQI48964.1 aminotransferase class I/II-fold pyridoxal phosphate-dependent enzyme [Streptococcus suis]